MDDFQLFVFLMFAATILIGISQKIRIPYPIGLVLGGAALGFTPYLKTVNFDPNLLLVIVLPPILYYAAFGISYREFKKNWREITSLALGLVIITTLVIGVIFKWIFPQFPWALAFTFGAIISPPDAIAATTILKRFAINNRLLSILEGESLVNDASAIVLYRLGIVALLSGAFSLYDGSIEFLTKVSGGIIVGLALGYVMQKFSRKYLEPVVGVVFSFTIPYITYILADALGLSGVLAVVVNGLMGSQMLRRHHSSLRRILGFAVWDIFVILLNCFVFILIGLQLRTLTSTMSMRQIIEYIIYSVAITAAMIAVRMLWVYAKSGVAYFKAMQSSKTAPMCPEILREAALIGWSGMRGIVSLTAALALPYTLPDGMPLEGRNEVIVITFIVILLTLLIPGLTLSPLIRWLEIEPQMGQSNLNSVRKQLRVAAEEAIYRFHVSKRINDKESEFLSAYFNLKVRDLDSSGIAQKKIARMETIRSLVIQEQRKKLIDIWEKFEIDDAQLTQLEHELDLEETQMARAELK